MYPFKRVTSNRFHISISYFEDLPGYKHSVLFTCVLYNNSKKLLIGSQFTTKRFKNHRSMGSLKGCAEGGGAEAWTLQALPDRTHTIQLTFSHRVEMAAFHRGWAAWPWLAASQRFMSLQLQTHCGLHLGPRGRKEWGRVGTLSRL